MTSYVAVRFNPNQSRTYTYRHDGDEPLEAGQMVRVPAPRDEDGWKAVEVESVTDEEPPFACKPILGLHTPEDEGNANV